MQDAIQGFPDIQKRCSNCGRALVIRENHQNGSHFLACTGYPECRKTEPIPETLRMRLSGHPELPLFGDDDAGRPTQISHFTTCPNAREHSKR